MDPAPAPCPAARPLEARGRSAARGIALSLALLTCACGAARQGAAVPAASDLPAAEGCDPVRGCRCVEDPAELGDPPAGRRRFQLRVGGAAGTRVGLHVSGVGTAVRPDDDAGERCFRVDLLPGSVYDVELVAVSTQANRPLSARWDLRELAAAVLFPADPSPGGLPAGRRPALYSTFATGCGSLSGPCGYEGARAWLAELGESHGGWDPCGSTQVRAIRVEGTDLPNDGRLSDVLIGFQLVLRRDPPEHPPETRSCPRR